MKRGRTLEDRLAVTPALAGLLQAYPNPTLAEMAGLCGYDFIIFDAEHGVFSEDDHLQGFRALAATNALAMVRLARYDTHALGRYLDMGAEGILVPNVTTADEADGLARAMQYPPAGTRGFGASAHRVTDYGLTVASHLSGPRAGVCLLVLIESALGVRNIDGILAVDGVDGVIIGPSDLTADLGQPRNFAQPAYIEAVERIERSAIRHGKLYGTTPHPGFPVETLIARGHRLLILDSDVSVIRDALSAPLARARACFGSSEPAR